jgi:hypothetical protein
LNNTFLIREICIDTLCNAKHFHDTYRHVDINDVMFVVSAFMLMELDQTDVPQCSRKNSDRGVQRLEYLTQLCTTSSVTLNKSPNFSELWVPCLQNGDLG